MATETAEHASGSGFPPFDQIATTGVSQIFWLILTFAVLYFTVANIFLPKIRKAVEDRDGAIKRDVAEAAALSAKADESVKQFEAQIAAARANARDTASKAKAEADAKNAAATAAKEAELNSRLAAAEARISETRTKAMANVSAVAEDAAAAIAERLTGAKPSADTVKKAVANALGA
ncbi:MAG TPA: ATPase [Hyphomonadaceae bacterium]|nr:ATPase [Hyphomonadaceae bacterium]